MTDRPRRITRQQRRRWRAAIAALRVAWPTVWPVTVRTCRIDRQLDGFCLIHRQRIEIRVNHALPWRSRADTLTHEWAHALEYDGRRHFAVGAVDHDDTWGVWFARCYRTCEPIFSPPPAGP